MKDMRLYAHVGVEMPKCPQKPVLKENHTVADVEQYKRDLEEHEQHIFYYFTQAMANYERHQEDNLMEFKRDVMEELHLDKHPRGEGMFKYVYSRYKYYGFQVVFDTLYELVEVFLGKEEV